MTISLRMRAAYHGDSHTAFGRGTSAPIAQGFNHLTVEAFSMRELTVVEIQEVSGAGLLDCFGSVLNLFGNAIGAIVNAIVLDVVGAKPPVQAGK